MSATLLNHSPAGQDAPFPAQLAQSLATLDAAFDCQGTRDNLPTGSPTADMVRVNLRANMKGTYVLDWTPANPTVRLTQAQCQQQAANGAAYVNELLKVNPNVTVIVKGMNEPQSLHPMASVGVPDTALVQQHLWFWEAFSALCPSVQIGSPTFYGDSGQFAQEGSGPDLLGPMMLAWALALQGLGVTACPWQHTFMNCYPSPPAASIGLTPPQYGALIADQVQTNVGYAKWLWEGVEVSILEWAPMIGENIFNATTYAEYLAAGRSAILAAGHVKFLGIYAILSSAATQPTGNLDQDGLILSTYQLSNTGTAVKAALAASSSPA